MRIAVTGATGFLGRFVVARLLATGHHVRALYRKNRADPDRSTPRNLRWIQGDMLDDDSLNSLVGGCDAAVHAAFEHVPGRYRGGEGEDPQRFIDVNLEATARLFELLQRADVKRTVFISSRAVFDGYGPSVETIGDDVECNASSLYGKVKAEAEARGCATTGIGFCALRSTGIYANPLHPGVTKWRQLILENTRSAQSLDAYSNQLRTEVHVDDVARAIEILLGEEAAKVEGKRFNCADIAVSERQLSSIVRSLAKNHDVNLNALPDGAPPDKPMRCDALRPLGWRPGGMRQLVTTLRDAVAAVD